MPIRFVSIQTGNNLLQYTVPFVTRPLNTFLNIQITKNSQRRQHVYTEYLLKTCRLGTVKVDID